MWLVRLGLRITTIADIGKRFLGFRYVPTTDTRSMEVRDDLRPTTGAQIHKSREVVRHLVDPRVIERKVEGGNTEMNYRYGI